MNIATVDMQGYAFPEQFILKEMSIRMSNMEAHFVFKPPFPYHQISRENRRIVNVAENNLLGIRYSYGEYDYGEIDSILYEYLYDVSRVYVRGHQKYDFLKKRLSQLLPSMIDVVNIERIDEWHHHTPPTCKPTHTDEVCSHHMRGGSYRCTRIIAENIFRWLVKCLPNND